MQRVSRHKRAFTQARQRSPVETEGALGSVLGGALDVSEATEEAHREYTHGFHSYPARMHPITARRLIQGLLPAKGKVLDPFCGSGTVIVEGVRAGAKALGRDVNPLAVMLSRAKVWSPGPGDRPAVEHLARAIADAVIEEGKAARRATEGPPREKDSRGWRKTVRDEQIQGIFAPHVRRELEALRAHVLEVENARHRDVLLISLSSILIKASKRESDTSNREAPRAIGRGMPSRWFVKRVEQLCLDLDNLWRDSPAGTPTPDVRFGDARRLSESGLVEGEIDLVVTSPPYAGTYDYLEHQELRLNFLELPVTELSRREVGARRRFGASPAAVREALQAYREDMGQVLRSMGIALGARGRAVLLIGDSLAGRKGPAPVSPIPVRADELLTQLAPGAGLKVVGRASQARDALGSAEKRAFATRAKREHIVLLEKA